MSRTVINFFGCCARPRKKKCKARLIFRVRTGPQSFVEGKKMRITNEQEFDIELAPLTAAGRPASVDGDAVFTSSDETLCTVIQTGPLTATVRAVPNAPMGAAQVVARVDADLGEGVREIVGSLAVEVVPAEAETVELKAGPARLTPLP
jgi:hypothetical protein